MSSATVSYQSIKAAGEQYGVPSPIFTAVWKTYIKDDGNAIPRPITIEELRLIPDKDIENNISILASANRAEYQSSALNQPQAARLRPHWEIMAPPCPDGHVRIVLSAIDNVDIAEVHHIPHEEYSRILNAMEVVSTIDEEIMQSGRQRREARYYLTTSGVEYFAEALTPAALRDVTEINLTYESEVNLETLVDCEVGILGADEMNLDGAYEQSADYSFESDYTETEYNTAYLNAPFVGINALRIAIGRAYLVGRYGIDAPVEETAAEEAITPTPPPGMLHSVDDLEDVDATE